MLANSQAAHFALVRSASTRGPMAVQFRFKFSRDVHSIPVPAAGMRLHDLKAAIVKLRNLGDDRRPVDLLIFDAASGAGEKTTVGAPCAA
jgi:hypothetical protein